MFQPQVILAMIFTVCFNVYMAPPGTTFENSKYHIRRIGLILVGMFVLDRVVAQRTKAPWMLLHAVTNLVIAVSCIPDLIEIAKDPVKSCHGPSTVMPVYMVAALHIYHLLAFSTDERDWFHHILFVGTLCPVGCLWKLGPVKNLLSFFICGLPGGLDYVLLFLMKHNMIHKLTEKKWNARINVWMRSPGCFSCCAVIYMILRYDTGSTCHEGNPLIGVAIALLVLFNGQYYMQVVVGNTFRRDQNYSS